MSCYFPNGNVATGHTPCNNNKDMIHCCDATDACLTNGYCLSASGNLLNTLTRGSCTDSTWGNSACPLQCSDVSTGSTVILNMASANLGGGAGTWCCNSFFQFNNTCQDATIGQRSPWAMANGRLIYDRENGSTIPVTAVAHSQSCQNVTLPASNVCTTPTQPANSTSTVFAQLTNSISATACATQTSIVQTTNTSREAAIGAGIAAPLALIIFLLTLLYLRAARSRKQLRQRLASLENQVSLALAAEKLGPLRMQRWELDPNGSQSILLDGTPVAELDAKRSTFRR